MNSYLLLGWIISCALAITGFSVFWEAVAELGLYRELHHAYWGLVLAVQPWAWFLWPLGIWWLWDDAFQHQMQKSDPFYQSLWHRWYVHVVRWVNGEV